jgi:2-keto-3-deoxy-L-fuconate dehydrogenase
VAAKHAVVGLPKVFAHENVDLGIRVNALSPGVVFSPILGAPDFDFANARDLYVQAQAFRRFAHPEEIAPALMFLCSDEVRPQSLLSGRLRTCRPRSARAPT